MTMYRPDKKYYEPLNRLLYKYGIPYVFDWSISPIQQIEFIKKAMNGMMIEIDEQNKIIREFLEVFDENLKEVTDAKLNEWLQDGTLENIINVSLFEGLNKKIDYTKNIKLIDFGVYDKDITEVLDLAIKYMNENTGFTLELPTGEYTFKNTVRLKDTKGTIKGQGKESTKLIYLGNENAIEIGHINATGDSWDVGYTTVIDINNLTISNGSDHAKNGLVIHTIGSVIDSIVIEKFNLGHGMLAKQLGYFNVINSIFKLNRVGVYANWSIYFNNCQITNNHLVGILLGGSCKIDNSLIEWQKPETGFNPNTRLINMITFNSGASKTQISNCYIEHDHVYYGYNQKYNPDIVGFEVGNMVNASTSVESCTFTDQPHQYIYSGNVIVENNKFNGGNFGIHSITKHNDVLPNGVSKPKVTIGKTNERVNINRMGGGSYISIDKAPTLLKNTKFNQSKVNTGVNTKTYDFTDDLKLEGSLWADSDFNVTQDIKTSDNPWDKNPILVTTNYKTITTVDFPRMVYEIDLEEGVTYYVSFNMFVKNGDIGLYTIETESGLHYLETGYKVGTLARPYDAVGTEGLWSRRLKEFTALKTEKAKLIFNTEGKAQGKSFSLQSVSISTMPGKL